VSITWWIVLCPKFLPFFPGTDPTKRTVSQEALDEHHLYYVIGQTGDGMTLASWSRIPMGWEYSERLAPMPKPNHAVELLSPQQLIDRYRGIAIEKRERPSWARSLASYENHDPDRDPKLVTVHVHGWPVPFLAERKIVFDSGSAVYQGAIGRQWLPSWMNGAYTQSVPLTPVLPQSFGASAFYAIPVYATLTLLRIGRRSLRRRRGKCPSCGYNLAGLESGACPECGNHSPESPNS
jgi:hypothetical protein